MNQPWVYMCSPSWTALPPPSPSHPSGSSQCTSSELLLVLKNFEVSELLWQIMHVDICWLTWWAWVSRWKQNNYNSCWSSYVTFSMPGVHLATWWKVIASPARPPISQLEIQRSLERILGSGASSWCTWTMVQFRLRFLLVLVFFFILPPLFLLLGFQMSASSIRYKNSSLT